MSRLVSPSALVLAVASAFIATTAGPAMAAPAGIKIIQGDDSAVTIGEATVDADPDTVFAAVHDFNRWPAIFPDIERVVVTARTGEDARVTMIGHNDHHDNLHFHNQPAARMIWFEDTGGRATVWLEMMLLPGAQKGTTLVHSRLFADVNGVASLVVSDASIRLMREKKLGQDLNAMQHYFAAAPAVAAR